MGFAGAVTQIKHRNLDLCFDADKSKTANGLDQFEITLQPCSLDRLHSQSWVFHRGPNPRDGSQFPGDYIRLASDRRYYLAVKLRGNDQSSLFDVGLILILKVSLIFSVFIFWSTFSTSAYGIVSTVGVHNLRPYGRMLSWMMSCAAVYIYLVDSLSEKIFAFTRTEKLNLNKIFAQDHKLLHSKF